MPRQGGAQKSLLLFVQALQGRTLIVELRSDLAVRGRIESVDEEMKCVALATCAACAVA
jgi:small nuclear ribonucleoprotein (snRNP)-like protein